MAEVVRLKYGHAPPEAGEYLFITQVGRIRGFDYYVEASPSIAPRLPVRHRQNGPGYASFDTALKEAQSLAEKHGLCSIYVEAGMLIEPPTQPPHLY